MLNVLEHIRIWWAWIATRRALRRFDEPVRGRLAARAEALVRDLLRNGVSPWQTLRRGIPTAARLPRARQLAAVLALARRLARRGIDPTPVLSHRFGAASEGFPTYLRSLERLTVRLAAEPNLDWGAVEPRFAALAREALDLQRAGGDYAVRVVPGRGQRFWVAGTVPGYEAPFVVQELYLTDSPQEVRLVPAPPGRRRRTSAW